jgi:membrane protein implicated in regulation of membrane protease activity
LGLLLALLVVAIAVGCLVTLRTLVGPQWLERLALGIQQFRGFRPVWHADRLAEYEQPGVGPTALVGRQCEAAADFKAFGSLWIGQVKLGSELWAAEALFPCSAGAQLRVTAIHGLTLRVMDQALNLGHRQECPRRHQVSFRRADAGHQEPHGT